MDLATGTRSFGDAFHGVDSGGYRLDASAAFAQEPGQVGKTGMGRADSDGGGGDFGFLRSGPGIQTRFGSGKVGLHALHMNNKHLDIGHARCLSWRGRDRVFGMTAGKGKRQTLSWRGQLRRKCGSLYENRGKEVRLRQIRAYFCTGDCAETTTGNCLAVKKRRKCFRGLMQQDANIAPVCRSRGDGKAGGSTGHFGKVDNKSTGNAGIDAVAKRFQ